MGFLNRFRRNKAAKTIYEKYETLQLVAAAESNIGNALVDLDRPPAEAIRHFETAKTIFERLQMPRKVAEVQENINILLRYVFSRAREIKERRRR